MPTTIAHIAFVLVDLVGSPCPIGRTVVSFMSDRHPIGSFAHRDKALDTVLIIITTNAMADQLMRSPYVPKTLWKVELQLPVEVFSF